MASSSEASCISDPNFAVICAFLERFANECGITYPPFIELQEMLENVEQVPQELIDLHIKLLRKARRSVFSEKWEKALIKYCHTYSNQDGWEIERFGYKKARMEVKLRVLKALLEGQFDLNHKFKAAVNTLGPEELRSKPVGRDKLGRIYWLQFDPSSNIRVYREDLDEESWTLVAKDRTSFVHLLQELSGEEIPLDLNLLNEDSTSLEVDKPLLDTGQSSNSSVKNDEIPFDQNSFKNGEGSTHSATDEEKDPLETEDSVKIPSNVGSNESLSAVENGNGVENNQDAKNEMDCKKTEDVLTSGKHSQEDDGDQISKKPKLDEEAKNESTDVNGLRADESSKTLPDDVIVGEAIEERVMIITGEGEGADCDTGNPGKEQEQQAESTGTEPSQEVLRNEQRSVLVNENSQAETKKVESGSKPPPKLWSIDTICGTSVNNSVDSGIDLSNQDGDIKAKHYSSFSIDSVLEKKTDVPSVSESPIVKSMVDSPNNAALVSEKIEKFAKIEEPLLENNSIINNAADTPDEPANQEVVSVTIDDTEKMQTDEVIRELPKDDPQQSVQSDLTEKDQTCDSNRLNEDTSPQKHQIMDHVTDAAELEAPCDGSVAAKTEPDELSAKVELPDKIEIKDKVQAFVSHIGEDEKAGNDQIISTDTAKDLAGDVTATKTKDESKSSPIANDSERKVDPESEVKQEAENSVDKTSETVNEVSCESERNEELGDADKNTTVKESVVVEEEPEELKKSKDDVEIDSGNEASCTKKIESEETPDITEKTEVNNVHEDKIHSESEKLIEKRVDEALAEISSDQKDEIEEETQKISYESIESRVGDTTEKPEETSEKSAEVDMGKPHESLEKSMEIESAVPAADGSVDKSIESENTEKPYLEKITEKLDESLERSTESENAEKAEESFEKSSDGECKDKTDESLGQSTEETSEKQDESIEKYSQAEKEERPEVIVEEIAEIVDVEKLEKPKVTVEEIVETENLEKPEVTVEEITEIVEVEKLEKPKVTVEEIVEAENMEKPEVTVEEIAEVEKVEKPEETGEEIAEVEKVEKPEVSVEEIAEVEKVEKPEETVEEIAEVEKVEKPEVSVEEIGEVETVEKMELTAEEIGEVETVEKPEVTVEEIAEVETVKKMELTAAEISEVEKVEKPEVTVEEIAEVEKVDKLKVTAAEIAEVEKVEKPELIAGKVAEVEKIVPPEEPKETNKEDENVETSEGIQEKNAEKTEEAVEKVTEVDNLDKPVEPLETDSESNNVQNEENEENPEEVGITPREKEESDSGKDESSGNQAASNEKTEGTVGRKRKRRKRGPAAPQRVLSRNRNKSVDEASKSSDEPKKKKMGKKGKSAKSDGESENKPNEEANGSKDEEMEIEEDPLANANPPGDEEDPLAITNDDHPVVAEGEGEPPKKSRKRRSTNSVSDDNSNHEEPEESGGKRQKMRGKKPLDSRIRKSVEEKREGGSSSDEEKKDKDKDKEEEDEKKSKKRGRPKKGEESGGSRPIASREVKLLGLPNDEELPSVRQSRRIAQMKLREEAERRRLEEERLQSFKDSKDEKKSKKRKKKADSDDEDEPAEEESDSAKKTEKKKKRKKKDKLKFNELNPWASSSGSSSSDDDEDEESDEEPHEDDELFKSDHEFSPESDVEDPDYKPMKRARTAKVESKDEPGTKGEYDDTACEKCEKNDHPEWILLCDKCDKGWHASCVRPALMVVPEGDWFCPPCEHAALVAKLQENLIQFDRCQKQRENEELRKKRLAFVGISLDNVLPPTKKEKRERVKREGEETGEGGDDSGSESGSESSESSGSSSESSSSSSSSASEPVYQLRERRTNVTSYRYNEYDELIKSALQEEIEAVKGAGNAGKGKDISNIVQAEAEDQGTEAGENINESKETLATEAADSPNTDTPETQSMETVKEKPRKERRKDHDEDYEIDTEDDDGEDDEIEEKSDADEIPAVVPRDKKKKNRKKAKSLKITSLEFTSEEDDDHNSDSDFKGVSSEEESEYSLPSESESSDGIRRKKKGHDGPVRRSTRARTARYDREFINDDSDDDAPRLKKSRNMWASSESSDSDRSWGRRRKRGGGRSRKRASSSRQKSKTKTKSKKKKSKKRTIGSDEDGEYKAKPRSRKVAYGGLDPQDEDAVLSRRTRGRKINYQEDNDDSDDDGINRKSRAPRIVESDDEFDASKAQEEEGIKEGDEEVEDEESGVDSNEQEEESDTDDDDSAEDGFPKAKKEQNGKSSKESKKISGKKSKRKIIPDPDDFSEDDLMEDEELDEFAEELEDLDEEEEEILGEMLEAGDIPVHELKSAVKKAKEGRKLKKAARDAAELKNKSDTKLDKGLKKTLVDDQPKCYPPIPAHLENPSSGPKFPKIGKMKITPSRSELAAQQLAMKTQQPQQYEMNPFIKDMAGSSMGLGNIKNGPEGIGPVEGTPGMGGLLLKTLQGDPPVHLNDSNIPLKGDAGLQHLPGPYPPPFDPARVMNQMGMLGPQPQSMLAMHMNNGPPMQPFNTFQDMISPHTRMVQPMGQIPVQPPNSSQPQPPPQYSSNLPTTVAGLSNIDASLKQRRKPGPKPGSKNKRKSDEVMSPENCDDGSESPLPQQQMEDFMKGIQDSPTKRKGRGRGKKQLMAEAQTQGKPEVTIATVQAPTQFPAQGLAPEGGSVITRMLNTPQGPQAFASGDPAFANQRGRPPFQPGAPAHFPPPGRPPLNTSPMRMRAPPPGPLYHASHPLDPSPSGGATISVATSNPRAAPPSQTLPSMLPRYPADPALRPPYPPGSSPPRTEGFPGFPNFYGNYPPPPPGLAGSDESLPSAAFQGSPYPDQFDETRASEASNSKSFEDEPGGGEFGGLASYFASQREDDLDT